MLTNIKYQHIRKPMDVRQHNACGVVLSAFFAKAKNDCIQNLMLPYAALDQISLRLGFTTSPYSRLTKFGSKKFIPVSENKFSSTHKFFGTSSSAALRAYIITSIK